MANPLGRATAAVVGMITLGFLSACGGGSSGGSGGLGFGVLWQQPGSTQSASAQAVTGKADQPQGGFGRALPPSVQTVRILFASDSGARCCVAVDPASTPLDPVSGQHVLVLQPLPVGPATVTIAGYPTAFAPAEPGVTSTCSTTPAAAGHPCSTTKTQAASFGSDPQPLTIEPAVVTDAGDIQVYSLPFLVPGSLRPAPGAATDSPAQVGFVVADATSGIDSASVAATLTQGAATSLSLTLTPCADGGAVPCSTGGQLGVSGFSAGSSRALSAGGAQVAVSAQNDDAPPRSLQFSWSFRVNAAATLTPTLRPTSAPTAVPTATTTGTPPPTPVPTSTPPHTAVPTNTPIPSNTPTPTATATRTLATPSPTKPPCTQEAPTNPCIPGGGSSATACDLEWLLSPVPPLGSNSIPKGSLDCVDGDPLCDFDGEAGNASCTFHVVICINNNDPRLSACVPSTFQGLEVLSPDPTKPSDTADAANAATLEAQAGGGSGGFNVNVERPDGTFYVGQPNATRNLCSHPLDIIVPLNDGAAQKKTLRLQTYSTSGIGTTSIALQCLPNK